MIYWIYEQMLRRQISVLPQHICFMISEQDMAGAPGKLCTIAEWCRDISESVTRLHPAPHQGIQSLTFHISTSSPEGMIPLLPAIRTIGTRAKLTLHFMDKKEVAGKGMDVVVAIGKSGREEITGCIRKMADDGIAPEDVDEKTFEKYLTFRYDPDIVIKTGMDHLTDFLIWQSVYSELYFCDINWELFRSVDLLRILRDYQSRVRRFGT